MHDLIVAAMQENRPVIKAHAEQMVTIFAAIIREGIETGEFEAEGPAEAARAVKTAFMSFFHPILIENCLRQGEDTSRMRTWRPHHVTVRFGSILHVPEGRRRVVTGTSLR